VTQRLLLIAQPVGGTRPVRSGVRPNVDRRTLVEFCLGQRNPGNAALTLLFTGVWSRYMNRYRHSRAHRNLLVNMSELGQRYLLLATALGLNTFMTPQTSYLDTQRFFGRPHFEEGFLYVIGMG